MSLAWLALRPDLQLRRNKDRIHMLTLHALHHPLKTNRAFSQCITLFHKGSLYDIILSTSENSNTIHLNIQIQLCEAFLKAFDLQERCVTAET